MTNIVERLQEAMHAESAYYAPQTTKAIEAMREAKTEIERLIAALSKARWHLNRYNQPDALLAIETALAQKP